MRKTENSVTFNLNNVKIYMMLQVHIFRIIILKAHIFLFVRPVYIHLFFLQARINNCYLKLFQTRYLSSNLEMDVSLSVESYVLLRI